MTAATAARPVAVPDVVALDNATRDYAWGSPTAIPTLLGEEPTGAPVAELWIGAHPGAPSRWADHPERVGLDTLVAADPEALLGPATARRFGRLPFLLKLLACDRALSLQVHPDLAQARAGFAAEEAAGVPRDAPHRNYVDDNHKPEMLVALTPFDALCGFRDPATTAELLAALDVEELAGLAARLHPHEDLRAAVAHLLGLDAAAAARLVAATARGAHRYLAAQPDGRWCPEARWAVRLAEQSPHEIGPVVALLLRLVHLEPGESVFLAAGQVHAYLSGFGVEILANSDNVLRCGLTPKHVDAAELLRIARFAPEHGGPATGRPGADGETVHPVPVPDFQLSRREVTGPVTLGSPGPQVLLVTAGTATVTGADGSAVVLRPGRAVFVPGGRTVTVTGTATLFRSVVGPEVVDGI